MEDFLVVLRRCKPFGVLLVEDWLWRNGVIDSAVEWKLCKWYANTLDWGVSEQQDGPGNIVIVQGTLKACVSLFAVFTVSSAHLLDWGYATEDSLCWTCRYAPIEGEAAAIARALEKCHMFIMGCPNIIVVSDYEPLKGLFGDWARSKIPSCFYWDIDLPSNIEALMQFSATQWLWCRLSSMCFQQSHLSQIH